jgi:hypothetical protein
MTLEDWQQEFISSRNDVPGLERGVWEQILASVLFDEGPLTKEEAVERMAVLAQEAKNRDYMAFIRVGRAQADLNHVIAERAAHVANDDAPVTPSEPEDLHPDLDSIFGGAFDDFLRLPDTRRLHAQAQAALLRSIERVAEGAQDADTLNTLADAYLRLPSPDEDKFED